MTHTLEYDKRLLTKKERTFVESVVNKATKHKFTVRLINKPGIGYSKDSLVNGYVDGDIRELAVATGKESKRWISVLVHESCHMDQAIEQCKAWTDCDVTEDSDASGLIFLWINNIVELNSKQRADYTQKALMVELDCERRAVEKILEHNLDYDTVEYTQRANAYVYFYLMIKKTRRWYVVGKEPYTVKEVWKHMPKTFDNNYTRLPAKYAKLYEKYCF